MKKLTLVSVSIIVLTNLINSQNIIGKLGGTTINETFDLNDSNDNLVFRVQGDGGVLLKGTVDTGTIPATGIGTRMIWYPKKAAFRAGYVSSTQWDDTNIGYNSTAMGQSTTASGYASTAMGRNTIASGQRSTAMGHYTKAESYASVAIGRYNVGGGNATSWVITDPLFEIGNGADGDNKANAMTVLKNGNVGIGTISPLSKLSVGGNGNASVTIWGETAASTGYGVYGYASNNGNFINYGGIFQAAGTNGRGVYGIASNVGDVLNYGGYFVASGLNGRGVYGDTQGINGSGVYGRASGSNGTGVYGYALNTGPCENYGGYFQANGDDGRGVYGYASYGTGKGVVGSGAAYDFYADGTGTDYGTSSSIRWKRNIVEINNPLEKINELRGVYFDWDEEHGGGHDVGCIAEEVGNVLPEIVVYEENGIDANGMDYSKLTPLLIEAIKALQKRVEELESM